MNTKRFNPVLASILLIGLPFLLSGCNFFGESFGDVAQRKVQITIVNGESEKAYEVTIGKQAQIDEYVKIGYFLDGFYDQNESGTKYFDTTGKSVSLWDESFPTLFYTRWKTLDNLSYQNTLVSESESLSSFSAEHYVTTDLPSDFYNGIKGNLLSKIYVTVKMKLKIGSWTSYFDFLMKDGGNSSGETYYHVELSKQSNDYYLYDFSFLVDAEVGHNGNFHFILAPDSYNLNDNHYIKNFDISVIFQ